MRALIALLIISVYLHPFSTPVHAKVPDLSARIYQKRMELDTAEIERLKSENAQLRGQLSLDYQNYLKQFYAQDIALRHQNLEAYQWQLRAATIILWLIIGITLAGIVFSGIQLWHGLRIKGKGDNSVDLEISMEKLRLKSSVVGFTVLILSGAFFLIFVERIYGIEVTNTEAHTQATAARSTQLSSIFRR